MADRQPGRIGVPLLWQGLDSEPALLQRPLLDGVPASQRNQRQREGRRAKALARIKKGCRAVKYERRYSHSIVPGGLEVMS